MKQQQKQTFDLGYILGVYHGDGSVHRWFCRTAREWRCHYLKLSTIDLEFAEFFRATVSRWSGKTLDIKTEHRSDCRGGIVYRVQYCSTEDCAFIVNYNLWSISDTDMKRGFVKGFFDSEGWFSYRGRTAQFSNTDLNLLHFVGCLLFDLEIPTTIHDGRKEAHEFRLCVNDEQLFSKFIQLMNGVTITRKLRPEHDQDVRSA